MRLIFGDVLYLISVRGLFELCRSRSPKEVLSKVRKAAFVGLVYGYHDYVASILSEAVSQSLISRVDYQLLYSIVKKLSR